MTPNETAARLEALETLAVALVKALVRAGHLAQADRDMIRDALLRGAKPDPVTAEAVRTLASRI